MKLCRYNKPPDVMSELIQNAAPVPRHVAIIMDGNGRWAEARGLRRIAGHRRGADAVRTAVRGCQELGIRCLTIYAFSSENWKRPAVEIDYLMGLLRVYIQSEIEELHSANVKLRFIGNRAQLPDDIVALISQAEALTVKNSGLALSVAMNYGGRDEIVRACQRIATKVELGEMTPVELNEDRFAEELETFGLPDPDLLIRTSGEQRLSNFLLWQLAYAELVFVDTLWPDFTLDTLRGAIAEYQSRDRRYGASSG